MNTLLLITLALAVQFAILVPGGLCQDYHLGGLPTGAYSNGPMSDNTFQVLNQILGARASRLTQSALPKRNQEYQNFAETTVQPASVLDDVSIARPTLSLSRQSNPTHTETTVQPTIIVQTTPATIQVDSRPKKQHQKKSQSGTQTIAPNGSQRTIAQPASIIQQTTPVNEQVGSLQNTQYQMMAPLWSQAYALSGAQNAFAQPASLIQQTPAVEQTISIPNIQYQMLPPQFSQAYAPTGAQNIFVQPAAAGENTLAIEPIGARSALPNFVSADQSQSYPLVIQTTFAPEPIFQETLVQTTVRTTGLIYDQVSQSTGPILGQPVLQSLHSSLNLPKQQILQPPSYIQYQETIPEQNVPSTFSGQSISSIASEPYIVQSESSSCGSKVQVVPQPKPYYVPYTVPRYVYYPVYQPIYVPVTQAPIVEEVIVEREPQTVYVLPETTTTEAPLVTVTQVVVAEALVPLSQPLEPCVPNGWGLERIASMLPASLSNQLNGQYDVLQVSRSVDPDVTFRMSLQLPNGQCNEYALTPNTGATASPFGSVRRPAWQVANVSPIACPNSQSRTISPCSIGSF